MALYVVTDSIEENRGDGYRYSYRYKSSNGSRLAQDEVKRRIADGRPAVLWRREHQEATLVERHNV